MLDKVNLYKLFESLLPFLFPRPRRISSVPLEPRTKEIYSTLRTF